MKRLATVTFLTISLVVMMSAPAAAWGVPTHEGIGEETAEQGAASDEHVDKLAELAYWADVADVESGTFGYDAEYNPWYDALLVSSANADHWLNVYNYDRWWATPEGTMHLNSQEFIDNAKTQVDYGNTEYGLTLLGRGSHFIQDTGVTYHVVAWDNFDGILSGELSEGLLHHFEYEGWVDDTWEENNFDLWTGYGASASWAVDTPESKSDIEDLTVEHARQTKSYQDDISGQDWYDNVWATQYNLYYSGQLNGAMYDYVAPGYFDY